MKDWWMTDWANRLEHLGQQGEWGGVKTGVCGYGGWLTAWKRVLEARRMIDWQKTIVSGDCMAEEDWCMDDLKLMHDCQKQGDEWQENVDDWRLRLGGGWLGG